MALSIGRSSLRRGFTSTVSLCYRQQPVAPCAFVRYHGLNPEDFPTVVRPDGFPGEHAMPPKDGETREAGEKIIQIVELVKSLSLIETVTLVEKLKAELNISDIVMSGGGGAAAEPEEEAEPVVEQTDFTVKLESFKADDKIKLIKEIKACVEGLNLVQARKFLETLPATVQSGITKDEAEALRKKLEEAGAQIKIE